MGHLRRTFIIFTAVLYGTACQAPETNESNEPLGQVQQAFPNCVAAVEGLGIVAAGWIGLRTDGTLWRGSPGMKEPGFDSVSSLGDVDGEATTFCAVRNDDSLWCWGKNDHGQVGNGNTLPQDWPVQVTALGNTVAQAATSNDFACALKLDGSLWCWGANDFGQLGDGLTQDSLIPVHVATLGNDVAAISAGFVHACALKTDDTVWCWGNNSYGEIGIGSFVTPQPTPQQILVVPTAKKVSAGGFFTCAIDSSDKLFCWGDNGDGHLGIGNYDNQHTPIEVTTLGTGVIEVDTSVRAACAIKTGGAVWCWGWQEHGRLGNGSTAAAGQPLPVTVSGPLGSGGAARVHLAEGAGCAVTPASELYCWGAGGFLDGTGATAVPAAIDFCTLPTLDNINPTNGSTLGGTTVTLTGTQFDSSATVTFGSKSATQVNLINATTLEAVTADYWVDVVDVTVTVQGNRNAMLPDAFTYSAPPGLYGVDPASGPLAGGTFCTLTGSNFQTGATVSFDGVAATNVSVTAIDTITLNTPAHAAGLVDVVVQNPDTQTDTLTNGFNYVPAPIPTSVDPNSGTTAGGTPVTISGSGFQWNTAVTFGGVPVTATYLDPNTLGLTTPPHAAGPVDVVTTNTDSQNGTLNAGFTYVQGQGGGGAGGGTGGTGVGGTGVGAAGGSTPAGGGTPAGGSAATGGSTPTNTGGNGASDADATDEKEDPGVVCVCQAVGMNRRAGWPLWVAVVLVGLARHRRLTDQQPARR